MTPTDEQIEAVWNELSPQLKVLIARAFEYATAAIRKPQDAYSDKQWGAVYNEIVKEADGLRVEVERLRTALKEIAAISDNDAIIVKLTQRALKDET